MSQAQTPEPVEEKVAAHSMKWVVGVSLGAIALIVAIILIAQFAIGAYGGRSLANDPAMAPEALAKRIGPVARLHLEGDAEVAPAAAGPKVAAVTAAPAAPAASAAPGKADGKKVYDTACMACHATGAAGAPKLGDKAAWAPRLKAGTDALYASSVKGKGAMPPKGGNASLSDAEVKAAVDFLVAGSK